MQTTAHIILLTGSPYFVANDGHAQGKKPQLFATRQDAERAQDTFAEIAANNLAESGIDRSGPSLHIREVEITIHI
jgi:hypothetical protein